MSSRLYLNALGIISPLGDGCQQNFKAMLRGDQNGMVLTDKYTPGQFETLGMIQGELLPLPDLPIPFRSRNNRVLLHAFRQIEDDVAQAIERYGPSRVGIIVGSSTSGVEESERAIAYKKKQGHFPDGYHFNQQEIGSPALFLKAFLGLKGPAYTVSSACASGGKSFAAAARLINMGLCDAVIVGGADTLCALTVAGFRSLQAVSDTICNPLSQNRNGTNIGEGSALFLMSKEQAPVEFLGAGESSDAHHISAPDPSGAGAEIAMGRALTDAKVMAEDVLYLNLHGTATELNDRMETAAINRIFSNPPLLSSTKPLTAHTLGAAGAIEAGLVWLSLMNAASHIQLPPHLYDGELAQDMGELSLVETQKSYKISSRVIVMSNSFAFGGSNVSIILGREM